MTAAPPAAVRGRTNPDLGELAGLQSSTPIDPGMLLHDDVVTDGQAEASALPGRLGREEGIEHLLLHLGRNAGAVVANPDLDVVAEVLRRSRQEWAHSASLLHPALCAWSPHRSRWRSGSGEPV